jgi:GH43 family beta-xylosidase
MKKLVITITLDKKGKMSTTFEASKLDTHEVVGMLRMAENSFLNDKNQSNDTLPNS